MVPGNGLNGRLPFLVQGPRQGLAVGRGGRGQLRALGRAVRAAHARRVPARQYSGETNSQMRPVNSKVRPADTQMGLANNRFQPPLVIIVRQDPLIIK